MGLVIPGSPEAAIALAGDLEASHQRDRLDLSVGTAELIIGEYGGRTRNVGLYAVAMYCVNGAQSQAEKEEWLRTVTACLDTAQPGDTMVTTSPGGAKGKGKIVGVYKAPDVLPTEGIWHFNVNRHDRVGPYIHNGLPGFEGNLSLDETVALGMLGDFASSRRLSRKWVNSRHFGNYDEPNCDGVIVGLNNIVDSKALTPKDTRFLQAYF